MGSSPHTRGLRIDADPDSGIMGIIPAYAGPTFYVPLVVVVIQDHPRIRGASPILRNKKGAVLGSSPHTRGLLLHRTSMYRQNRIIPAYAGPTDTYEQCGFPLRDHPRIRGAYEH